MSNINMIGLGVMVFVLLCGPRVLYHWWCTLKIWWYTFRLYSTRSEIKAALEFRDSLALDSNSRQLVIEDIIELEHDEAVYLRKLNEVE